MGSDTRRAEFVPIVWSDPLWGAFFIRDALDFLPPPISPIHFPQVHTATANGFVSGSAVVYDVHSFFEDEHVAIEVKVRL